MGLDKSAIVLVLCNLLPDLGSLLQRLFGGFHQLGLPGVGQRPGPFHGPVGNDESAGVLAQQGGHYARRSTSGPERPGMCTSITDRSTCASRRSS